MDISPEHRSHEYSPAAVDIEKGVAHSPTIDGTVVAPVDHRTGLFAHWKADIHAAIFEFIGTFVFLTLGLGGIQSAAHINGTSLPPPHSARSG